MPISQSPALPLLATLMGTIVTGFGVNALFRPAHALSFFELAYPTPIVPAPTASTNPNSASNIIDALMAVYGIRDIFMGVAIYTAAWLGDRKTLGWLLVAGSAVAFGDGLVCLRFVGYGQGAHWGYAPMLTILGSLCLGIAG